MTVNVSCASCGIEFCLPDALYSARKRDGAGFYCPNGHSLSYRPTEDQKRIAELEDQLAKRERYARRLSDEIDEIFAQREELIGELKQCPGRCGWKSRRQIPRDPVGMGRGLERVRVDIAQHLVEAHGAKPVIAEQRMLESG